MGLSDSAETVAWLRPFSPVILKARLPEALLEALKRDTETLLQDEALAPCLQEGSPKLDNMHRHIHVPDFLLYGPEGLARVLEDLCLRYLREVLPEVQPALDVTNTRASLTAVWINSQVAGDFIPLHLHDGNLSGIAFLAVPEALAAEKQEAGRLQFFDGRPIDPYLVRARLLIDPRPGDVYIFPSWLQHLVYPFRGEGERRSMNFNVHVYEAHVEPDRAGEEAVA